MSWLLVSETEDHRDIFDLIAIFGSSLLHLAGVLV